MLIALSSKSSPKPAAPVYDTVAAGHLVLVEG
jgi:hypothetical protein